MGCVMMRFTVPGARKRNTQRCQPPQLHWCCGAAGRFLRTWSPRHLGQGLCEPGALPVSACLWTMQRPVLTMGNRRESASSEGGSEKKRRRQPAALQGCVEGMAAAQRLEGQPPAPYPPSSRTMTRAPARGPLVCEGQAACAATMWRSLGRLLPARGLLQRPSLALKQQEVVRWSAQLLAERGCGCHATRRSSSASFAAQVDQLPVEAATGAYDAQQIQARLALLAFFLPSTADSAQARAASSAGG